MLTSMTTPFEDGDIEMAHKQSTVSGNVEFSSVGDGCEGVKNRLLEKTVDIIHLLAIAL